MEVPAGIISIWSGAIINIPPGWSICDGTGGTPDLRDKFIAGAGSTYAVGAEGGNVNHNHTFTGDGHTHQIGLGDDIAEAVGYNSVTQPNTESGTTNNASSLPPYYALAYIMKN